MTCQPSTCILRVEDRTMCRGVISGRFPHVVCGLAVQEATPPKQPRRQKKTGLLPPPGAFAGVEAMRLFTILIESRA